MFVLCKLLCGELVQVFSMLFLELSIYAICADVIFINKYEIEPLVFVIAVLKGYLSLTS